MSRLSLMNDLSALLEIDVTLLTDHYTLRTNSLWDSLALVSTIGLIDQYYHFIPSANDLLQCDTIGDIFALILKHTPTYIEMLANE